MQSLTSLFEKGALAAVAAQKECVRINPYYLPFAATNALSAPVVVSDEDIKDAEARLLRFAPFIKKHFPETEKTDGIALLIGTGNSSACDSARVCFDLQYG